MSTLLDSNMLVALAVPDHVHHVDAHGWLEGHEDGVASCPITQGSLLRVVLRSGESAAQAQRLLAAITADERHEFWSDIVPYAEVPLHSVVGHRQVTDAYLAQLARIYRGLLATFDNGLAIIHPDVAELVPHDGDAGSTHSENCEE